MLPRSRAPTWRRSATLCSRSGFPRRGWSVATSAVTRTCRCARAGHSSSVLERKQRTSTRCDPLSGRYGTKSNGRPRSLRAVARLRRKLDTGTKIPAPRVPVGRSLTPMITAISRSRTWCRWCRALSSSPSYGPRCPNHPPRAPPGWRAGGGFMDLEFEDVGSGGLLAEVAATVAAGASPAAARKWWTGELTRIANATGRDVTELATPAQVAELAALVNEGTLTDRLARQALEGVIAGEGSPREIVDARGLAVVSDDGSLYAAIDEALAAQPDALAKIRDGKVEAAGVIIGAVMRATKGTADAARVRELVLERAAASEPVEPLSGFIIARKVGALRGLVRPTTCRLREPSRSAQCCGCRRAFVGLARCVQESSRTDGRPLGPQLVRARDRAWCCPGSCRRGAERTRRRCRTGRDPSALWCRYQAR